MTLLEREGVSALSVRRLGTEVGVDGTAFYRHFGDKDDLVLAVGGRVMAWIRDRVEETTAPDAVWQDRVRAIMRAGFAAGVEFPAAASLMFHRTTGTIAERQVVELMLDMLAPLELEARQTVLVYRMVGDVTLAMALASASTLAMPEEARGKDATAWSRIYAAQSPESFPRIHQYVQELVAVDEAEIFAFTVETLIAGIERLVGASRGNAA
ncbi:TetR/AcrR family transcriptional regulator [Phycicoccus sp. Soil803]|uniref:TetR/AcrR family transcriptional regulator n=1 Tax=Phycicoccus sp. Soil803 TaxID=1736415 RepID=UPI00070E5A07|nr:TetR/AcrR family transcriptional regulator [Phycicoccus sp. Soil803]KRF21810.1 hypothetical protein ASG95_20465 [Phycicoccus sp. Soil803]